MSWAVESAVTSVLPTTIVPAVAVSSPPIMFSSVVFPLPLGPIIDTNSPSFTDMLSPRRA